MAFRKNQKIIKIYPSITTTGNYQKQIKEVKEFEIEEVCLFPTGIDFSERKRLYNMIENAGVKNIPFVHIRHDMTESEIEYLKKRFKTQTFNIHSQDNGYYPLDNDLSKYNGYIYIETTTGPLNAEPGRYAGICLDTAHVENQRLNKSKLFNDFIKSLEKYPVGITHISAVGKTPGNDNGHTGYDNHTFSDLSEFDYVARYKKYLSGIIALELENSIHEQLLAKSYLEKILED